MLTDSNDIACYLNNDFAKIGLTMASSIPPVEENDHQNFESDERRSIKNSFFISPCSPTEIINIIELIDGLQNKQTSQKMDVDTKFIKFEKNVIAPFRRTMFKNRFKTGIFPDCLKNAEVLSIFKNGDTFEAINYRPISLLSRFDKILEKHIFVT